MSLLQVQTKELVGRTFSPNMKVHSHPEDGGAEVEAILDPPIIGWSVGLVSRGVSLGVWATIAPKTRAEGYLVKGVPDPDEGSSALLCLFLCCQETGGVVCWGVGCGIGWPSTGWVPENQRLRPILCLWTIYSIGICLAMKNCVYWTVTEWFEGAFPYSLRSLVLSLVACKAV